MKNTKNVGFGKVRACTDEIELLFIAISPVGFKESKSINVNVKKSLFVLYSQKIRHGFFIDFKSNYHKN